MRKEYTVNYESVIGSRDTVMVIDTDDFKKAKDTFYTELDAYPELKSFDWAKDGLSFFDKAWNDCYRLTLCQWTYDIDEEGEEDIKCNILKESDVLYIPEF